MHIREAIKAGTGAGAGAGAIRTKAGAGAVTLPMMPHNRSPGPSTDVLPTDPVLVKLYTQLNNVLKPVNQVYQDIVIL